MQQDKNIEQLFWDDCAKKRIYAALDKEEYTSIFDIFLGDLKDKIVLDLGCASGISAILLGLRGAKVIGIDISPELIEQANNLARETSGDLDVKFEVGDAENLNIQDESADIIFFGGVIHHFPEKAKLISECRRVLKKGGRILAIEPNFNDYFQRLNWRIARKRNLLTPNEDLIRPAELRMLLENNGFDNIRMSTFREHLSFLGLLFPGLRKYFEEHGNTTLLEKILLFPIDIFRSDLQKGNFLIVSTEKI